jgi:hypothetical protein
MPPMKRQLPNPLKYMRQKQASNVNLLAAWNKPRAGALKEQKKRAIEAAKNRPMASA